MTLNYPVNIYTLAIDVDNFLYVNSYPNIDLRANAIARVVIVK